METTHRVIAETDTGTFVLLFRGSEDDCLKYHREIANREVKEQPTSRHDLDNMIPPGTTVYIATVDPSTVLTGRERAYEVAGKPLAAVTEVDVRIEILRSVDTGSELTHRYARRHGVGNVKAVRDIRAELWRLWYDTHVETVAEGLKVISDKLKEQSHGQG